MSAMVAESKEAVGAAANNDALSIDRCQKHLTIAKFTLITDRPAPALKRPHLERAGASITVINSYLVAINQSASEPAGDSQDHYPNGHHEQYDFVRL